MGEGGGAKPSISGERGVRIPDEPHTERGQGLDAQPSGADAGGPGVRSISGREGGRAGSPRVDQGEQEDIWQALALAFGVEVSCPGEADHLREAGALRRMGGLEGEDDRGDEDQWWDEPPTGSSRKRPSAEQSSRGGLARTHPTVIGRVQHEKIPIPDVSHKTRWPWAEMSVGSSFCMRSKDKRMLKRALLSMMRYRVRHAPWTKYSYRKTQKGYRFWRIR